MVEKKKKIIALLKNYIIFLAENQLHIRNAKVFSLIYNYSDISIEVLKKCGFDVNNTTLDWTKLNEQTCQFNYIINWIQKNTNLEKEPVIKFSLNNYNLWVMWEIKGFWNLLLAIMNVFKKLDLQNRVYIPYLIKFNKLIKDFAIVMKSFFKNLIVYIKYFKKCKTGKKKITLIGEEKK